MKREVKSPKGAKIQSPAPPRSEEREFAEAIKHMLEQMEQRFRNQVFKQLHKSTVEKFATEAEDKLPDQLRQMFTDQQTGNFANVFLSLAKKVRRKLTGQFPDDRLDDLAKEITGKVNRRNQKVFYGRAEKRIGIKRSELEATEGLTYQINAYQLETAQWIKKIRDETLEEWTASTLRQMAEGRSLEDIMSQFDGMVKKRKNHAEMVARTQISSFNSFVTNARARNLGIEKAIWVTSEDERVRGNPDGRYPNATPSHHWAHGREFDIAKGLTFPNGQTLLPGVSWNCRCDYRMIIPSMDDESA